MIKPLLAIDPGKETGWAYFDAGRLAGCGLLRVGGRIPATAYGTVVVVELPQVYRQSKSKGDPNDLIKIAFDAALRIGFAGFETAETIRPAEWKGQIPKEIHHPRILAELTETERAVYEGAAGSIPKSYRHNTIDAIGLGLWYLKSKGIR